MTRQFITPRPLAGLVAILTELSETFVAQLYDYLAAEFYLFRGSTLTDVGE